MNEHTPAKFEVKVKRIGKRLPVSELKLLEGYTNHLWGFAKDGDKLVEFDVTWGDEVIQL